MSLCPFHPLLAALYTAGLHSFITCWAGYFIQQTPQCKKIHPFYTLTKVCPYCVGLGYGTLLGATTLVENPTGWADLQILGDCWFQIYFPALTITILNGPGLCFCPMCGVHGSNLSQGLAGYPWE
jgi:hypothetical protein